MKQKNKLLAAARKIKEIWVHEVCGGYSVKANDIFEGEITLARFDKDDPDMEDLSDEEAKIEAENLRDQLKDLLGL